MNGSLIMPYAPHLPTDKCGPTAPGAGDLGKAYGQGAVQGVRCYPEITAIRYSLGSLVPTIGVGSDMIVTRIGNGTQEVPFKQRGLTEENGWMTTLINNYTFSVGWRSVPSFTNLSYVGHVENFRVSLALSHRIIVCLVVLSQNEVTGEMHRFCNPTTQISHALSFISNSAVS